MSTDSEVPTVSIRSCRWQIRLLRWLGILPDAKVEP